MATHTEWASPGPMTNNVPDIPSPQVESMPDASQESSPNPWLVAAGVGCIAAYIAHTTYQSYRIPAPQVFFRADQCCPKLVGVNLPPDVSSLLTEALGSWADLGEDLDLSFSSLNFVEEDSDYTPEALPRVVRAATMTAFEEISYRTRRSDEHAVPAACVTYRSAVKVNGESVELLESNARTIQRANGLHFWERHVVGFTVDGQSVEVLTYDVKGVLDISRATGHWSAKRLEEKSVAEILRYCCVPSQTSFHPQQESSKGFTFTDTPLNNGSASPALTAGDMTAHTVLGKSENVVVEELLSRHWRSPLPLLRRFAATLRYSSGELNGCKELLRLRQSHEEESFLPLPHAIRRFLSYPFGDAKKKERHTESASAVVKGYCGRFYVAWGCDGKAFASDDVKAIALYRHTALLLEPHTGSRPTEDVVRECFSFSEKGILFDMGLVPTAVCSVLHADNLRIDLSAILTAAGLSIKQSSLVVAVSQDGSKLWRGNTGDWTTLHHAGQHFILSEGADPGALMHAIINPDAASLLTHAPKNEIGTLLYVLSTGV